MSLGEIDTLNLLTEKLSNLFDESQGYYETFLDTNNLYKKGKLTDKEFFQKLGDYTVAYSALEFLAIKVILEIKKSLDTISGGQAPGGTHSPGLMPGMGSAGMMAGGLGGMGTPNSAPRAGTPENPVRPDLVEHYTEFLEAQWAAHRALAQRFTRSGEGAVLTPEQLRTLRALGYIQ